MPLTSIENQLKSVENQLKSIEQWTQSMDSNTSQWTQYLSMTQYESADSILVNGLYYSIILLYYMVAYPPTTSAPHNSI